MSCQTNAERTGRWRDNVAAANCAILNDEDDIDIDAFLEEAVERLSVNTTISDGCSSGMECSATESVDNDSTVDDVDSISSQEDSDVDALLGFEQLPLPPEDINQLLTDRVSSHRITRSATNDLLAILRKFHPSLPKDARTLLGTQTNVEVRRFCGGDYYHFGILKYLRDHASLTRSRDISLQINIDGLPLFNSTKSGFWPILGKVDSSKPFIIALFYGAEKPNNLADYLQDFISEYSELSTGSEVNDCRFTINLTSIICDAPARAFVKQTEPCPSTTFGIGKIRLSQLVNLPVSRKLRSDISRKVVTILSGYHSSTVVFIPLRHAAEF